MHLTHFVETRCCMQAIKAFAPSLFPLVHAAYLAPYTLFWGDKTIQSAEGVQQGDPLGPLLFCVTIHPLVSKLKSEFCVWYLDDGTVGGEAEVVKEDLEAVRQEGLELGLELNEGKSEVICADPVVRDSVLEVFQGAYVIDPTCASLLGSPIGDEASVFDAISEKTGLLQLMGERLQHVSAHYYAIPLPSQRCCTSSERRPVFSQESSLTMTKSSYVPSPTPTWMIVRGCKPPSLSNMEVLVSAVLCT